MKRRIISSKMLFEFVYEGPAFRFDRYVGDFYIETTAVSFGKAKSNVLGRIKKELNLDYTAKLSIDENFLKLKERSDFLESDDQTVDNSKSSEEYYQPTLFEDLE